MPNKDLQPVTTTAVNILKLHIDPHTLRNIQYKQGENALLLI